jgi:hypothetical protein
MRNFTKALAGVVIAVVAGMVLCAGAAQAEFLSSMFSGGLNESLTPSTLAGAHPYELKTSFVIDTTKSINGTIVPAENVKDLTFDVPPGIVGNAQALPKCSQERMDELGNCPVATQIGIDRIKAQFLINDSEFINPVYNLEPPAGVPAQFGIIVIASVAHINFSVRTGDDYGVTAKLHSLNSIAPLFESELILWGVPGDPSHDAQRFETGRSPEPGFEGRPIPYQAPVKTLLNNPTSCTGPLVTRLNATSYQNPNTFSHATSEVPGMTGCENVPFTPSISVLPETTSADSPTGVDVDLHVPQNDNPHGLVEANLKDAAVTLPAGMTVNPSSANGLAACSPTQIELHGPAPAACPDASKVGLVEVETPLIDHPLKGGLYVAAQSDNPFGSLLALYLTVNDPKSGIVIKLAGKVSPDPVTGQLTATFDENPQLPFEDLKIHLYGGNRASLATPAACGSYATQASLTPWTAPASGPPVAASSAFDLTSGAHGAPCAALGFAPAFTAGTLGTQAGAFSPFSLTLTRDDGEQRLGAVSVKMPAGLAGVLAGVPLCPEAQANAGSCPQASQIGHVMATAGVGGAPVTLPEAGKPQDPVYLTGPYHGAPFGLSVVVPAEAGPFNLDENGKPIVVRSKIEVDSDTGQVSVVSDPLPTILQGIPTDIRALNVVVDREGFTFAPTDCNALSVAGSVSSTQGATAGVSSHYQATDCGRLAFKPKFTAGSVGKSTKANGASLSVKLVPPAQGPRNALAGSTHAEEANIARVKVQLPKQLPSRLSTLQKACLAAVFAANPASCPAGSVVGHAIARTPLLSSPLAGPAYFVSRGGEAFPQLVIVLQGEGVTVNLVGNTRIKSGITSSTFASVPDLPVSSFELSLPQGPNSALGANLPDSAKGSFCGQKMALATEFVGQNGVAIHQSTPIGLTGCPKAKATRAQKLTGALKACKKKPTARRASCERAARKKYGRVARHV